MSDQTNPTVQTPIKIFQDANIFVTEVHATASEEEQQQPVTFELQAGRQAYLLCVEGSARVTTEQGVSEVDQHDAAEVFGPTRIVVRNALPVGSRPSHMLMVEMKQTGPGRTDL